MIVAHIGGVPVEESLAPVVSGVVVGLLLTRTWIASQVRSWKTVPRNRLRYNLPSTSEWRNRQTR